MLTRVALMISFVFSRLLLSRESIVQCSFKKGEKRLLLGTKSTPFFSHKLLLYALTKVYYFRKKSIKSETQLHNPKRNGRHKLSFRILLQKFESNILCMYDITFEFLQQNSKRQFVFTNSILLWIK